MVHFVATFNPFTEQRKTDYMTTFYCNATIEHQDGSVTIKRWKGKRGAARLKAAMRLHFKASPTVKHFALGNVYSVNSYGAH